MPIQPAERAARQTQLPDTVPSGAMVLAMVGLGYLALSQYVIVLNDPVHLGAGFWPAAGLTLGALLWLPRSRWPWVIAAIAAAETGGGLFQGYPLAAVLWWTAGNCLEPLVGALLVRRFGDPRGALVPVRNLLIFIACGVFIAPLIGASIGSIGSVTVIGNPFWQVWPKYVVGDALGVLVIAPLLLAWHEVSVVRRLPETALLIVGLTTVNILAFRNWPYEWDVILPYLIVPFLTWAALRYGIRGAAWAVMLTANVANIATAVGYGPFAIAGEPTGHAITLLQIFLAITAATTLILAALVDDLTDRQAAEAALRQQAALLDKARDAIVVLDMHLCVKYWNQGAERLYGWRREAVLGEPFAPLTDRDAADVRAAIAEVLQYNEWSGALDQVREDGRRLTVEGHWTLVRDDAGTPQSIMAINTDITERVAMERRLHQAQRLEVVGQLTGGVAHDFNNLLMVIVGNAELLSDQLEGDVERRPLADTIVRAAQRGAELVRQMLAFARRQVLAPQAVDVDKLVTVLEPRLREVLGDDIAIERVSTGDVAPALVDSTQFEVAVLELADNAREAMPHGGNLRLETAEVRLDTGHPAFGPEVIPGNYVMLAVADTGTGIAADHRDRVFEPFFTTKSVGKGAGLGLSMVYGFIKQSGGHISIDSAPGTGTTVQLYLPLAPLEEQTLPGEPVPPALADVGTSDTKRRKILLVDDDELVRSHVAVQLASLGYEVITAGDGAAGLERLRETADIDILFTDVVMPGEMNGLELARAARELRPDLPVLFTSGYADNILPERDRRDRRTLLLSKPYRRQDLVAALERMVGDSA